MALTYLNEGDVVLIQGSGKNPYKVRKIGGVVDCSCPAWKNIGGPIDNRICKHIRANIDPSCLLPQAQAVLLGKTTTTKVTITSPTDFAKLAEQINQESESSRPFLMSVYAYLVGAGQRGEPLPNTLKLIEHLQIARQALIDSKPVDDWADGFGEARPTMMAALDFARGVALGTQQPWPTIAENVASTQQPASPRLTKTGKISTAHKAVVVKPTAPPVLLAHKWEGEDPTGWWMSVKYDGIRVWWTGEKLLTRLGNEIHAPQWFLDELLVDFCADQHVLDGELWIDRGKFQETVSVVKKFVPNDEEWKKIKFMVFDGGWFPGENPEVKGGTFEDRYNWLDYEINHHGGPFEHIKCVEQVKCRDKAHFEQFLAEENAKGGEGIMLRKPGSLYESGRSSTCLKVKSFVSDEAVVIGYTAGLGKHKGRVGALVVKWNDKEFELGTGLSDNERKNPPTIGSVVTFNYKDLTTNGIPKIASYVGVRDYE